MERTRPAPSHRLFSGLAGVLQPALAQKISCSVRQASPHIGGHYINEGPELSLVAQDLLFRPLALGDVGHRPNKLAIAGSILQNVSYRVDVLDSPVSQQQAILMLEVSGCLG